MGEKMYTVTELSEIFGKSRQTIHRWLTDGRFPNHTRTGDQQETQPYLVPVADVEKVIREDLEALRAGVKRYEKALKEIRKD